QALLEIHRFEQALSDLRVDALVQVRTHTTADVVERRSGEAGVLLGEQDVNHDSVLSSESRREVRRHQLLPGQMRGPRVNARALRGFAVVRHAAQRTDLHRQKSCPNVTSPYRTSSRHKSTLDHPTVRRAPPRT